MFDKDYPGKSIIEFKVSISEVGAFLFIPFIIAAIYFDFTIFYILAIISCFIGAFNFLDSFSYSNKPQAKKLEVSIPPNKNTINSSEEEFEILKLKSAQRKVFLRKKTIYLQ